MSVQGKTSDEIVAAGIYPIQGFKTFKTHHCVTGSMLHIYHFNRHPLSEDMLLGLGSGIGFFYWHMKGQTPMLLGRGNVHRPGIDGLEIDTGRRSGVQVERFVTKSIKKATAALRGSMDEEQPMMIHVDMGYLPYFDLPDDYHFGQHVVVVAGMDSGGEVVLLADRDGELHPISMEDLERARSSTYQPFPPMNTWYRHDFTNKRHPAKEDIWEAISDVCESMLRGPISNFGVRGIRRAAKAVKDWPRLLDEEQLRETAFNSYIFIDAEGGSGGGMFRYMYSRFLREAAEICENPVLMEVGEDLALVGDDWQEIAKSFKHAATADDPTVGMKDMVDPLNAIAEREQVIWEALDEL
jgi:hypothetical protein